MAKQLNNVAHDFIRYANCWEDADVLLSALKIESGDKVLSIGSAGDNSFSMLVNNPELVLAVDVNLAQLRLIELKKAAFIALNHDEFLEFLGFKASKDRMKLYDTVRKAMDAHEHKDYWDKQRVALRKGIIFTGKFERYFRLFRRRILPLVHYRRTVNGLFEVKSEHKQREFFDKKWNTWRWNLLFKIFFSRFVMGRFGRDPRFLDEVKVKVSDFILDKAARHLSSMHAQENYFLHFIMKGNFGKGLPHYARKENFEQIKNNIHKLHTFHGFAEEAFKKDEYQQFSKFNLSNIFEYMDMSTFKQVTDSLVQHATQGAVFAYWNLMVPRKMRSVCSDLEGMEVGELRQVDKGFFYDGINCDLKK